MDLGPISYSTFQPIYKGIYKKICLTLINLIIQTVLITFYLCGNQMRKLEKFICHAFEQRRIYTTEN